METNTGKQVSLSPDPLLSPSSSPVMTIKSEDKNLEDLEEVEDVGEDEVVIDEAFVHLPEKISATLSDPRFDLYCDELAEKYRVAPEKRSLLAACTQLIMDGTLSPAEYVGLLMEELTVDRATAANIAQDINRDIFSPLKDELREIHKLPPSQKPGTDTAPRPIPMEKKVSTAPAALATEVRISSPLPSTQNPIPNPKIPESRIATPTSVPRPPAPPPAPVSEKSILEQKLAGIFQANTGVLVQPGSTLSEHTGVQQPMNSSVPPPPRQPNQTSSPRTDVPTQFLQQPPKPRSADPYREPIDDVPTP